MKIVAMGMNGHVERRDTSPTVSTNMMLPHSKQPGSGLP